MTYGELKSMIVDLGFEESSIVASAGEYASVCRNAINRATSLIYATVIYPYADSLEAKNQKTNKPTVVTADTDDTTDMKISPLLEQLVPLLAGHYVWLDDDLTKATIYWNEYDDLKTQILQTITKPKGAKIEGGF